MTKHLRANKENLIYLGLWIIMFLAPILSQYFRTVSDSAMVFRWAEVFNVWKIYLAYFAIFLIHNFILAPLLIYKHRTWIYVSTTLSLVVLFFVVQCIQRPQDMDFRGPRPEMMEKGPHQGVMPPESRHMGKQGNPAFRRPNFKPLKDADHFEPPFLGEADIVSAFILIGLLGLNIGIKLYFKSSKDNEELEMLEKKNLEQQLEYLKYQINPHFFMNTLNNIHALVDIDPEKAKATVVELSKMMRYVLYESNKEKVDLQQEHAFMLNYLNLMKLRYTNKVSITLDVDDVIPNKSVAPLIFITFVENAFKHGVSYQKDSFINIKARTNEEKIYFECINSKHHESTEQHGGVGLSNLRKRLKLIYRDTYELSIKDEEDTYKVSLTLPLFQGTKTTT